MIFNKLSPRDEYCLIVHAKCLYKTQLQDKLEMQCLHAYKLKTFKIVPKEGINLLSILFNRFNKCLYSRQLQSRY